MYGEGKQKLVGLLIFGGIGLVVLGLILFVMAMGGGAGRLAQSKGTDANLLVVAGLPLGISVLGVICVVVGLLVGFRAALPNASSQPIRTLEGIYITSRFGLSRETKDMVFTTGIYADDAVDYFVQIQLPGGTKQELRCAVPVWEQVGEGMHGTATVQGDWLCQFVMAPRAPGPTGPPTTWT